MAQNPTPGQVNAYQGSQATGTGVIYDALGNARVVGASMPAGAAAGSVLTSDSAGNTGWQPLPMWAAITNGENTLPRSHLDDSGSFTATPATQVLLLTLFTARTSGTYGHVAFQTGGTAQSGNTLSKAGLYSVAENGNVTLLSGSSSGSFSGTYTTQSVALTTAQTLTQGAAYAVGILQVGATSASLLGGWFNAMGTGGLPVFCYTLGSQSDLPASAAKGSLSTGVFAVYAELLA